MVSFKVIIEELTVQQLSAVAVLPVKGEFSCMNVSFQSNYREMNSSTSLVKSIKTSVTR